MERLDETADPFQRWQLVEALGSLPGDIRRSIDARVVADQIHREARGYLQTLADLNALGLLEKGHLEGQCVTWSSQTLDPSLVDRLLGERLDGHLRILFGLTAIAYPPRDVWAAHRSLVSGRVALRNHALEYLDNTLTGEVRRDVFAVIGDDSLEEKMHVAERELGVEIRSRVGAVDHLLGEIDSGASDENHLTLAALYMVHTDRIKELYSRVKELMEGTDDPFVSETAVWVARRLGLSVPT